MAIPDYVPRRPDERTRSYESPPWQPEGWRPDRPGDLDARQPVGPRLGYPGPDQGYAWRLARQFEGKLYLRPGEHERDVVAGCLGVATKRSSLYGRAPVVHDLTIAFTIWGFLDDDPATELVEVRRPLFAEVASPHHYDKQRTIVDLVPEEALRQPPHAVAQAHRSDWRSLLDLPA